MMTSKSERKKIESQTHRKFHGVSNDTHTHSIQTKNQGFFKCLVDCLSTLHTRTYMYLWPGCHLLDYFPLSHFCIAIPSEI